MAIKIAKLFPTLARISVLSLPIIGFGTVLAPDAHAVTNCLFGNTVAINKEYNWRFNQLQGTFGGIGGGGNRVDIASCTIGDKTLNGFSFLGDINGNPAANNGFDPEDTITFKLLDTGEHQIILDFTKGANQFATGAGTFNYDISVINSSPNVLDTATLNFVNPSTDGIQKSSNTFSTLTTDGSTASFVAGTKTASITDSWTAAAAPTTGSITNTYVQRSTIQVPGPLPVLGAGVAFAYSRKLRKRINRKHINTSA